mmetsp:Transcript_50534/g.101659  ORF Transcript_50534/g.101659 Transcript_50534/m.101659 type:complete len:201 (+) Transcript_50534:251-853(+)
MESLGRRSRPRYSAVRRREHRHPRQGHGQARRDPAGHPRAADDLHRRGQRLRRGLRAVHPRGAQALARGHHHGRQRRHEGDDGGANFQRRGHHQGRHRPRQRLHHSQADGRGLSPALRCPGVRRCSARLGRPHHLGRRMHVPRRRLQGLRRGGGLRDARRDARGAPRVRWEHRGGGRRVLQGLLRHVQRHCHEEACRRRR